MCIVVVVVVDPTPPTYGCSFACAICLFVSVDVIVMSSACHLTSSRCALSSALCEGNSSQSTSLIMAMKESHVSVGMLQLGDDIC